MEVQTILAGRPSGRGGDRNHVRQIDKYRHNLSAGGVGRMRQRCDLMRYSRNVVFWMLFVASGAVATLAAHIITGQVRNQTRWQPAANDAVILLRVDHGLEEEERTQTDARGSFTLAVHHSDKTYLLRVVHNGVNYDQRASPGDS